MRDTEQALRSASSTASHQSGMRGLRIRAKLCEAFGGRSPHCARASGCISTILDCKPANPRPGTPGPGPRAPYPNPFSCEVAAPAEGACECPRYAPLPPEAPFPQQVPGEDFRDTLDRQPRKIIGTLAGEIAEF